MATMRTMSSAVKLVVKSSILPNISKISPALIKQSQTQWSVPIRWGSYERSPKMDDRPVQTEVEIINDPEIWAQVERLIAPPFIPRPTLKEEYPSGWKSPNPDRSLPYFISRTINHMYPVHVSFNRKTQLKVTKLRKIQGDIWALESDIKQYLEKLESRTVVTSVHEVFATIYVKGDHASNIMMWLEKKGF